MTRDNFIRIGDNHVLHIWYFAGRKALRPYEKSFCVVGDPA